MSGGRGDLPAGEAKGSRSTASSSVREGSCHLACMRRSATDGAGTCAIERLGGQIHQSRLAVLVQG
eukprot:9919517-Alexandrium_andersonii.AAC.1